MRLVFAIEIILQDYRSKTIENKFSGQQTVKYSSSHLLGMLKNIKSQNIV